MKKTQNLILNLGTGIGTSVLDLLKIFEKVNKIEIPVNFHDRRAGDKEFIVADNSLAKSILNWQPKRDIEDICKDGWNWQLRKLNDIEFSYFLCF